MMKFYLLLALEYLPYNHPLCLYYLFFAALGVKSSFQLVSTNIWVACGVIGIVAFVLPLIGGFLGKKIGCFLKNKAGLVGGLVLIGIGVKILLEHLLA